MDAFQGVRCASFSDFLSSGQPFLAIEAGRAKLPARPRTAFRGPVCDLVFRVPIFLAADLSEPEMPMVPYRIRPGFVHIGQKISGLPKSAFSSYQHL